jgi:hypothetical protein
MSEKSTSLVTGKARFSYANIHKPRLNDRNEEVYSVTVIVPKSDTATHNAIAAAIKAAARKKFPGKPDAFYAALKSVVHDGDGLRPSGEPFGPECKGAWVFTASSKEKPGVVDEFLQPLLEPIKSGDYGRVDLNFYGFDTAGNRGVAAGLNNVQLLERGESLGGRRDAATAFGQF